MPQLDPPKISVDSVESIPSASGAPRFKIQLRVINPNTQELDIAGISYGIEIMDQEVISGVTNDVPLIPGYAEQVVTLEAGLQLFQIVRLLTSLGKAQGDTLEYRFLAKIDFKGLVPTQRVEETGELTF
jgi:LEA14-like dessication related protein